MNVEIDDRFDYMIYAYEETDIDDGLSINETKREKFVKEVQKLGLPVDLKADFNKIRDELNTIKKKWWYQLFHYL